MAAPKLGPPALRLCLGHWHRVKIIALDSDNLSYAFLGPLKYRKVIER